MGALDRYLARQILVPFAFSVAGVVALVLLLQVRRLGAAALGMGLSAGDVFVILSASLPAFLVIVIPLAYLASVMIGLGRLSADRELIAMSAAGASPWRLALTPLIFGALLTLLSLPLAHFAGPLGMATLRQRLIDVGIKNVSQAIRPGVFSETLDGITLYAREKDEDGRLRGVMAHDRRDPDNAVLAVASLGRLSPSDGSVVLELEGGEVHFAKQSSAYDRLGFGKARMSIDVRDQVHQRTKFLGRSQTMSSAEILELMRSDARDSLDGRRTERDYWRRFAHPLMVLVFGLLGAAICLRGGPRGHVFRVVLGLLSVVAYYLLGRAADFMVTESWGRPFLAVFAPNLVVFVAAVLVLSWPSRA